MPEYLKGLANQQVLSSETRLLRVTGAFSDMITLMIIKRTSFKK
jgi:hypothetical protein